MIWGMFMLIGQYYTILGDKNGLKVYCIPKHKSQNSYNIKITLYSPKAKWELSLRSELHLLHYEYLIFN